MYKGREKRFEDGRREDGPGLVSHVRNLDCILRVMGSHCLILT